MTLSKFSLPPPCSYDELYSSYQNEWDQHKHKELQMKSSISANTTFGYENLNETNTNTNTNTYINIHQRVSGLEWVTLQGSNGEENDTYLLACTESGEILVWKLTQARSTGGTKREFSSAANTDSALLLKRYARCKITHPGSADSVNMNCNQETKNDQNNPVLNEISLVRVASKTGEMGKSKYAGNRKTQTGNKRQRQSSSDVYQSRQEFLLIVAGEGGLWSILLSDILAQPWEKPISTPQQLPVSFLKLSCRSIIKVQTCQNTKSSYEAAGQTQRLFALERDTNTLAIWNLSAILGEHAAKHAAKHAASSGATILKPDAKYHLSRIFSTKQRQRVKCKIQMGCEERATTVFIHTSLDNSKVTDNLESALFVGTDRSRLWIIPLLNNGDLSNGSEPHFLSLHEPMKNSSTDATRINNNDADTSWKVADILVTKGGTWCTVAAVLGETGNSSKTSNVRGLLITWHASTGMVVARQETREAITTILQHCQLYSAANEGAITVWDSAFGLKRTARFWTSPLSSKAMAILTKPIGNESNEHTIMAVAGVGDRVDLFADQCRVHTARI